MKLAVIDIDGCLTPGEAQPWDFEVLEFVRTLNRHAKTGDLPFAVTLITGRQEPYVEAMMQAIDGFLPAIYENGGGLYFPQPYRFVEHPLFTPQMRAHRQVIENILRRELVEPGIAQIQPGKQVTMTLYPARVDVTFAQIVDTARHALGAQLDGFSLYASVSSVEILPDGVNKGAGLEWLSHELGIPLSEVGGIGDANPDLLYLNRVGNSAAPANATDQVKAAVHYVSPESNGRGVRDILERWLA